MMISYSCYSLGSFSETLEGLPTLKKNHVSQYVSTVLSPCQCFYTLVENHGENIWQLLIEEKCITDSCIIYCETWPGVIKLMKS